MPQTSQNKMREIYKTQEKTFLILESKAKISTLTTSRGYFLEGVFMEIETLSRRAISRLDIKGVREVLSGECSKVFAQDTIKEIQERLGPVK